MIMVYATPVRESIPGSSFAFPKKATSGTLRAVVGGRPGAAPRRPLGIRGGEKLREVSFRIL
jgi:hypothetical protein